MPPLATLEERREYQRQWVAKQRSVWLQGKGCTKCSSTDRLEVDHIDPSTKVSNRIWSWSRERRAAELAKCQVLCHDCHVIKTTEDAKRARSHNRKRYYRDGCRCDVCSEAVRRYNERKNEMRRAVRSAASS